MSTLDNLAEDIRYIRTKVDSVDQKVDDYQLSNERRISKLEERAGIFGMIGGFVGAIGAFLGVKLHGQ